MSKVWNVVKIIGKVLQWVLIVILGFICFISISMIISKLTSKDRVPKTFGFAILNVETPSMVPTIYPNDIVIIKSKDTSEYQVNDVVAFFENDYDTIPTLHRIISREGDTLVTKGDYVGNSKDEEISVNHVVGESVLVLPKFGNFVKFVRTPIGILTILLAGFVLIEAPSLIRAIFKKEKSN